MNGKQHEFIVSLHNECFGRMKSYAYRRTGDERLAEECVQETFLIGIIKIEELSNHEKPDAWLLKTLYYVTLREMDRAYRKAERPLDDVMNLLYYEDEIPLEFVLLKELSPDDKELLILRIEKQWSYEQIAEHRGISQVACRKQMSRALLRCKELMKNLSSESQSELADGLLK